MYKNTYKYNRYTDKLQSIRYMICIIQFSFLLKARTKLLKIIVSSNQFLSQEEISRLHFFIVIISSLNLWSASFYIISRENSTETNRENCRNIISLWSRKVFALLNIYFALRRGDACRVKRRNRISLIVFDRVATLPVKLGKLFTSDARSNFLYNSYWNSNLWSLKSFRWLKIAPFTRTKKFSFSDKCSSPK